jgi:hypothetical protein
MVWFVVFYSGVFDRINRIDRILGAAGTPDTDVAVPKGERRSSG